MSSVLANTVVDQIDNGSGYYLGFSFQQDELQQVRALVQSQWMENIKQHSPKHWEKFSDCDMDRYHELSDLINHASIWAKTNRVVPRQTVDFIRSTSLIKALEDVYGEFTIANEENLEEEEISWRLVRPNEPSDMGPLHADAWFWALGCGCPMPAGVRRIKVWIALHCVPGQNGLCVVPESHKKEWRYHAVKKAGLIKPEIDEDESTLPITLAYTKPGDAIVFHDKLLHGGAANNTNSTRVSLEFTMFVKDQ